jgi:NAD(P)-dependent dehydrogenase (short-subunit alcohol dehydrogenase family)
MFSTDFTGRTVVITGGASGIGLKTGEMFAQANANVVLIDRDWKGSRTNGRFLKIQADVGSEEDVEAIFAGDKNHKFTCVDVLVNSAGENLIQEIVRVSSAQWDRVMESNLKSAFLMCRAVIPLMEKKGGSIINVSSTASLLPRTNDPVYGISKAALNDLSRRLALKYGTDRIRMNAVCPGAVSHTRIQLTNRKNAKNRKKLEQQLINAMPLGRAFKRMIRPDEVASLIFFLAGESAKFITGAVIPFDGGKSLGIPPYFRTNNVG